MNIKTYFEVVAAVSRNSKCKRAAVGAVLVRDGRIISTGYNGLPSKFDDTICKELCTGCDETVHAEMNAILYAARAGVSTAGAELYCNLAPCINCAKHIINAGIKEVYYNFQYKNNDGIALLTKAGIMVNRIVIKEVVSNESI